MHKIDNLLQQMLSLGASDLHLCCGAPVVMRIYSKIKIFPDKIFSGDQISSMLQEIMPERNYQEFSENGDTDFAYEMPSIGRLRVNVFMDRNGIGSVFRIIPNHIMTVEELKLPDSVIQLCYFSKGLVLVTGPTGSGKSTTLAAMIDFINRNRQDHIVTIEDPIEFVHKNQRCLINQREVKVHTKNFKSALRAALREDPDVILVGELRDLETIEIALETAETGHLVFGTLHTTTAAATVDRLIDQFPANQQGQIRMMLASTLKGVISQVLLPTMDGTGMIAALEILIVNQAISANIREGKTYQIDMAISTGKRHGMKTLNESLLELASKKVVSAEEAYLAALDKESFMRELERLGLRLSLSQVNKVSRSNEFPISPSSIRAGGPSSVVLNPKTIASGPKTIVPPPLPSNFKHTGEDSNPINRQDS